MTRKERISNQILGKPVDRIPTIGGWIGGARNLAELAGVSIDEYLANPERGVILAHKALGVDGMVMPIIPQTIEEVRGGAYLDENADFEPEAFVERASRIPATEAEVLAGFDAAETERILREYCESFIRRLDGITPIPNIWEVVPHFMLYLYYGYYAYLSAIALYPEAVGRIYWEDAVLNRAKNRIMARLIHEYELPPIMFAGWDICNNAGPMCSPGFLRRHYWPMVKYALEPYNEAGIRVIHHCDGNVMPLIDDMIGAGFSGFQGFQYECGVDPYYIAGKTCLNGERPIFMAGLSCTRTLPYGTVDDVIEEVEYCLDYTDGGKGLLLFTSSSTGMEVPVANIRAAYSCLSNHNTGAPRDESRKRREWPWRRSHR